jgi:hypothetical protein
MFRGEFIRADGLVIPNNITRLGSKTLLEAATRNTVPAFFVGLVNCVPDINIQYEDTQESTIGVNGYTRIPITRDNAGWVGNGYINDEAYVESGWLTWTATGTGFDEAVNRLMLCNNQTLVNGAGILAISTPMPAAISITPATILNDRRFKYRLYGR